MAETSLPTNRLAVVSFFSAWLTLFSFCIGWAPFLVGSALVCYPGAFFFGAISMITGFIALRQLRSSGESGRWMALTGAIFGGLLILITLFAIALTLSAAALFIGQLLTLPTPQPTP